MNWSDLSDKWTILGIVNHLNKFMRYLFERLVKQASGAKTAGNFVSWDAKGDLGDSGIQTTAITSGWISADEAWIYASATTFTIAGDKTGKYQKGDKIKLTQTTNKFFFIVGVSYSMPNTTITVRAGSDYSLINAAITSPYYSKDENPQGWPGMFNLTGPTWTTTGTAFSNVPTNDEQAMRISGNVCTVIGRATCNASSGGTGQFNAVFLSAELPPVGAGPNMLGICANFSALASGIVYVNSNYNIRMAKYDGTALAGNSQIFRYRCDFPI